MDTQSDIVSKERVYLSEFCLDKLLGLVNLRRTDSGDFAVLNSLSEISKEVDF